jgi:hypothetical protein
VPINAYSLLKERTLEQHIELRRRMREYVAEHPGCVRDEVLAHLGCSRALFLRLVAGGVAGVKLKRSNKGPATYWPEECPF